jgi:hypothetical protein
VGLGVAVGWGVGVGSSVAVAWGTAVAAPPSLLPQAASTNTKLRTNKTILWLHIRIIFILSSVQSFVIGPDPI